MLLDSTSFEEVMPHYKGSNFRNPTLLSVADRPIGKVLVIGACTTQELPHYLGTEYDHVIYHGGVTPKISADNKYGLQIWQFPTRALVDAPRLVHSPFSNAAEYEEMLANSIKQLRQCVVRCSQAYKALGGPIFVCNFLVPTLNPVGRLLRGGLANPQRYISDLNKELEQICAELDDVYVLDLDQIANTLGKKYFSDEYVDWFSHNSVHAFMFDEALGRNEGNQNRRMESSPPMREHFELKEPRQFHEAVAAEIKAMLRAYHGVDAVKMVVVDLDDTLWKGVLGDKSDKIHYDHPYMKGRLAPMAEGWPKGLAEALLYLKRRGIILGIISRNDESVVKERFPEIFEGELELDDFAVRFINFDEKPQNMESLLKIVNLLPESVLYIDDNPVERARMSNAFPAMRIFGRYFLWHRHLLLNAPETQVRVITEESGNRSQAIVGQVQREADRTSMNDEEFLASLGLTISVVRLSEDKSGEKINRCVELTNKTNQWNSTGAKTDIDSIRGFIDQGGEVFCFFASDNYTTYGDICFVSLKDQTVTQFVMSCRVAGLATESAALKHIMQAQGLDALQLTYIKTEKNSPFRLFADRFQCIDGSYVALPDGLDATDHVTMNAAEGGPAPPPAGLTQEWLTKTVFSFETGRAGAEAPDRHQLNANFTFEPDGGIGGYRHPNEAGWRIEDRHVLILDTKGDPTCRAEFVLNDYGSAELAGPFLLGQGDYVHYFRPVGAR
jgi:FkbH-like protein